METRAGYMIVGLFVLLSLAGTLLFFLWITRSNLSYTSNLYTIYFSGPVTGLTVGGPVNLLGVPVGTIRGIALNRDHPEYVEITVAIREDVLIKNDAYASLELQGLTGYKFIQIYGGAHASPILRVKPGQRYPVITARYSGVEEIMTMLPRMVSKLTKFVDNLNVTFNDENKKHFSDSLKNIDILSQNLAESAKPLNKLIANTNTTMTTINQEVNKVGQSAQKVLQSMGNASDDIKNYLEKNKVALDNFTQSGSYELLQAVSETRKMVKTANNLFEKLNSNPRSLIFESERKGIEVGQ